MTVATKSKQIGMRQGAAIANLSQSTQLDLIAEGLPVLMGSANDLFVAAYDLTEHSRAAAVLEGHALEEVAKILILMDIVRCPEKQRSSRIGRMMRWFYSHLARLLYVDAQSWKPQNIRELQSYIDHSRQSHYLEQAMGGIVMPNWTVYLRESSLYADIIAGEEGILSWNEPAAQPFRYPALWDVCVSLRDIGAFSRDGLDIVSKVWSQTDFNDIANRKNSDELTVEMLSSLKDAELITGESHDLQKQKLCHNWQLPMYRIDFDKTQINLEDLQNERAYIVDY